MVAFAVVDTAGKSWRHRPKASTLLCHESRSRSAETTQAEGKRLKISSEWYTDVRCWRWEKGCAPVADQLNVLGLVRKATVKHGLGAPTPAVRESGEYYDRRAKTDRLSTAWDTPWQSIRVNRHRAVPLAR